MRAVTYTCALLAVFLGALVILGWYTGNANLIQVHETFVPMQFNTALCFLLLGLSLLFAITGRSVWSNLAAFAVALIGILTILEYALGISFGIDELLMEHYITTNASFPGRMGPNTAVCFLLASLAINFGQLLSNPRVGARWSGLLASLVLGLAFVAFSGYLAGVESAYGWAQTTPMAVHTSIGFLTIGTGIFVFALIATESIASSKWISVAFGIGLFAAGAGLWQALANEQNERVESQIYSRSHELLTMINQGMKSRVDSLGRMASRWKSDSADEEQRWREDASALIATTQGIQAVEWVDSDLKVRWIEPLAGNERALGFDLTKEEERRIALIRAQESGRPIATKAIELAQGGKGFLLFIAIDEGDNDQGFILGVFRIAELFDALVESIRTDFEVSVFQGNSSIYGFEHSEEGALFPFAVLGNQWQMQLVPKPEYIAVLKSTLPIQVLLGSLLVSILVGTAVFLAQTAQENVVTARRAKEALQASELYHRSVIEELPIGLLTVSESGVIQTANECAIKLFEYDRSDLVGRNVNMLIPENLRDKQQKYLAKYMVHPEAWAMGIGRELFAVTQSGRNVPIEIGLAPFTHNGILHVLASIVDISQRKRAEEGLANLNLELEDRVLKRTAELEAANKELDEFTHIASHDLQEPLRKQQMFTTILQEEVGNDISDDAQRAMRAIGNASIRMQELIQSLLALSRARNRELNMRDVSLTQMVRDSMDALDLAITETGAIVELGHLPEVECDPILVTQVFQNLIGNGLRFAKDGEHPRISIEAIERNGNVEIEVRDLGIGIEAEALEKVFVPFKRLHTRNEYPGTGIGLSICKKVVERHGGQIWIESTLGMGSSFKFVLPKQSRG